MKGYAECGNCDNSWYVSEETGGANCPQCGQYSTSIGK